jgi:hypothetical protein
MKLNRLAIAVAAVLVSSPAWSNNQYRVSNQTYGYYYVNKNLSSPMFGLDEYGNPNTFYASEYLGYASDYNEGNNSGAVPAALVQTGTWVGKPSNDPSTELKDVDYDFYAYTTWGKNHARASFDNYQQVDTTSTAYYLPSDGSGTSLDLPEMSITTSSSSNVYGYATSRWEELYMIGTSSISALGHYNATFHVDGKLGPSANSDGTGSSSLYWYLRDFNGNNLVSISASYDAGSNSWSKSTYSAGVSNYQSGSGELIINENLKQNGGTFNYGTALYLDSYLQTYVDGNGVSNFGNTVEMTELELEGGSRVYAMSGTDLSVYNIAFDSTNGGGGVLCDGLNCATTGGGGGTVIPGVPEPETYAMMLAGLALVGWSARRRRSV